jgi:murein DD-endopeptidase MepM/ murein hydrolase activator NlpD
MKRVALALAALACAALPHAAAGQTFRIVSPAPPVPSFVEPNAPGSLVVPFDLSTPPESPAVRSYDDLLVLWREAGDAYGVRWQVLAAINKIESNFGQNMGPSSAGALGWMQFIPSTWMRWGMDADGDGVADPWNPEDAVYAAARYLAAAGAHDDLPRAIFAYNHAQWYVDDVLELAALFGDGALAPGSPELVFELAGLEERLADARRVVARTQRAIRRAEKRSERLPEHRARLERRAGDPSLRDSRFRVLEAQIMRLAAAEDETRARLDRLAARLDEAVAAVEALRSQQSSAAFALPAAAGSVASAVGEYVFPVGGGPDLVSVAHDHHDYPAADIAAPEGSPLYALAAATVTESYPEGDGRCGIGLKLRTETGAVFVYCHLSYLEPDVVPGAALAAGAPVGLVGSTGNSTGPHLHLAFDPALTYPQEEPWFEAFAGRAFSWQDAPTPERADQARRPAKRTPERVFRVVGSPVVRFTR